MTWYKGGVKLEGYQFRKNVSFKLKIEPLAKQTTSFYHMFLSSTLCKMKDHTWYVRFVTYNHDNIL